jgi:hypothetical protein
MAYRSGWRRVVLAVMLMLVSLPAMAGGRPVRERRGEEAGFTAVWRAAVRWVVPAGWLAKLGPGMDPDGITGRPVPPGCSGSSAPCDGLGPDMDPNG